MEINFLWLIVLSPLLGALTIRLFGKWAINRTGVNLISCGTVFISLILSAVAFFKVKGIEVHGHDIPSVFQALFPWIQIGKFEVLIRFVVDPLSSVMILVVSGVGFLIHVYSTGYMSHDKEYQRFFSYMNLFTAMMLVLVLADNLLLMFIGWEGVGLCSYLLIGFWFTDNENASAGKKAFIVNRIGDFGFMAGIFAIFWALGTHSDIWTVSFSTLSEHIGEISSLTIFGVPVLTFSAICFFIGAAGKSAQIPLYVWLPDAMAGPTPVSALIHAATMVTSGVYMICRLNFIYELAPVAMSVVAWVGVLTALYAATIAVLQFDIKKVLAYSTISQLGYMFVGVGVGAYSAGLFHLMTHAFFKALLFLGAGSVMHALSNEQDMRKMGGLRKYIPYTFWSFAFAYVAICGIFPFAGFFSKDEILWKAANKSWAIWAIGLITAGMTAFYMTRLFIMTFFGKERFDSETKKHIHESPFNMTIPLMILGALSIVGGWIGWPEFMGGHNNFHHYTGPVFGHGHADVLSHSLEWTLMFTSVGTALLGIGLAYILYLRKTEIPEKIKNICSIPYRVIYNKYYMDEIYNATFVKGTIILSMLSATFDKYVVDGAVNGCAKVLKFVVAIDGAIDKYIVDGAVNAVADVTIFMGKRTRQIQTGRLYNYLLFMIVGFLGVAFSIYYFLR